MDWKRFFERSPTAVRASRFRELAQGVVVHENAEDVRARIARAPAGVGRRRLLEGLVRDQVAGVMRLSAQKLDLNVPIGRLGLDSLMGLEIRNRLERQLSTSLPPTLVWNHPTVSALATFLLEKLGLAEEPAADAPPRSEPKLLADEDLQTLVSEVGNLGDDEIRSLLAGRAK
jgi:myxalamid-type polyketide synthase MxaE and MxaD